MGGANGETIEINFKIVGYLIRKVLKGRCYKLSIKNEKGDLPIMKKHFIKFMLIGSIFFLAACGNEGEASSGAGENGDWPEKIAIVQMPNEDNPNAASMHNQLREHLMKELDVDVIEYEGGSYAIGIEAMVSGSIDIMLATPMSFYQAQRKANAELLVKPHTDEETEYYTTFITQANNDEINSIEDLKGKNFAFVNAASSSGYLYPKGTLVKELDLDPDLIEQSGYFFENVMFSESHQNSMMGVAMGDFDAAAVTAGQYAMMLDAINIDEGDLKVIGRTQDIPDPSYIIRGDLPVDLKVAIRDAFISFDDDSYFEAIHGTPDARFVATDPDYYAETIKMLDSINALEEE